MTINKLLFGFSVLLFSVNAFSAPEPKSIQWEDTGGFKHVDGTGAHRNSQNLLIHQRNQTNLAAASIAVSQDIGDVAVIVDNGAIISQAAAATPFDLPTPSALNFVAGMDEFSVASTGTALDPTFGGNLGLGDDDTTEVALGG
jgi:hypothetical protein